MNIEKQESLSKFIEFFFQKCTSMFLPLKPTVYGLYTSCSCDPCLFLCLFA